MQWRFLHSTNHWISSCQNTDATDNASAAHNYMLHVTTGKHPHHPSYPLKKDLFFPVRLLTFRASGIVRSFLIGTTIWKDIIVTQSLLFNDAGSESNNLAQLQCEAAAHSIVYRGFDEQKQKIHQCFRI